MATARTAERYELGRRIQVARKRKGLTQPHLATQLAMPVGRIRAIERGLYALQATQLRQIADALAVHPTFLLTGARDLAPETPDERDLLARYRRLDPDRRISLRRVVEALAPTEVAPC